MKAIVYSTVFLLLLLGPSFLHADQSTTLFFPGLRQVARASGLIYSDTTTREAPAEWKYDNERDGVFLTVEIPRDLQSSSTLVSGVALDAESSELQFSPITFADLPDPRAVVPMCDLSSTTFKVAHSQEALMESLVEIRERRIQVNNKKLAELAPKELIDRLKRLESGFGFHYKEQLSLNLPPEQLATRLDALFYAISRYEYHKKERQ